MDKETAHLLDEKRRKVLVVDVHGDIRSPLRDDLPTSDHRPIVSVWSLGYRFQRGT